MSVLIKGMKMPEKCGLCVLFHAESPMHCTVVKGYKTVGAPYGMPRPDWCPLVDLGKHGKLVEFIDVVKTLDEDSGTEEVCFGDIMRAYYEMRNAPTIVEVED